MSGGSKRRLALLVLSGQLIASSATAQNVLLFSQRDKLAGGGNSVFASAPPITNGGAAVFMGPALFSIGSFQSSCLGCGNALGMGTTTDVTETFTAANPNFANFVSGLTSANSSSYLYFQSFLSQGAQTIPGSGAGALPPLLTSPAVSAINKIELVVNSFTLTAASNSWAILQDTTLNIYGTPGPAFTGPSGSNNPPLVININAAVSGFNAGAVTSAVELALNAGCYSVKDAYGLKDAIYDSFNYHLGVAQDWAWQYRVVNAANSATLLYAAAPNGGSPATKYATEAAASTAGLSLAAGIFCLNVTTTVGFVVDDNYLPDNTGGISLLVSPAPRRPEPPVPR